jgi:hypothetical protein
MPQSIREHNEGYLRQAGVDLHANRHGCLKNDLIPPLIQSHIGGVRAALESGIPTIRNRLSGHGQGPKIVDVPPHYASYMLHLAATTIQFMVESEKALK